jgi:4-hydroxy-3-polyprenylbenzoate decarboxylase
MPPVPAFYHRPETIEDLLRHTAGKVLDLFGLEHRLFRRWEGFPEGDEADDDLADRSGGASG